MRTATNKARMVDRASCPQCGREPTAHGCRAVAMGWFCLRDGLHQDPATVISATRGPDPAAGDPAVKRARDDELKAQRDYDAKHAKWVDAVARQRSAELKSQRQPMLYDHDLTPIIPETNPAEQRQLRNREEEARTERDTAGRRLVEARQTARHAVGAARRGGT